MKKQSFAFMIALVLAVVALPIASIAARPEMDEGVPVWSEETVKDYLLEYMKGDDLDTLWGYYDLQIRRYMPMVTYERMLTEIEWLTGSFIEFGSYRSFEEAELKQKTHVLHMRMEKQDLDVYFTHKNKADDWEVLAVEFVPAEDEAVSDGRNMLVAEEAEPESPVYTEEPVTVGSAPYLLDGILTLPVEASPKSPVPACVLVHGSGPNDMDETVGQTKMFADMAKALAAKGIATLRYDKRTYTYGNTMTSEEIDNLTVEEETIQDAIAAGKLLQANQNIDPTRIILMGHSMGGMLAPRIATQGEDLFGGIVMIAGTPKTLLEIMIIQNQDAIAKMDEEEQAAYTQQLEPIMEQVEALAKKSGEEARQETLFGVNAYYFWEMQQHDPIALLKKLKLPIYIVQGNEDFQVSPENGVEAFEDALGDDRENIDYKIFRGLNHLLMRYTGVAEGKGTVQEYDTPATLDRVAANDIAAWINQIGKTDEE